MARTVSKKAVELNFVTLGRRHSDIDVRLSYKIIDLYDRLPEDSAAWVDEPLVDLCKSMSHMRHLR